MLRDFTVKTEGQRHEATQQLADGSVDFKSGENFP